MEYLFGLIAFIAVIAYKTITEKRNIIKNQKTLIIHSYERIDPADTVFSDLYFSCSIPELNLNFKTLKSGHVIQFFETNYKFEDDLKHIIFYKLLECEHLETIRKDFISNNIKLPLSLEMPKTYRLNRVDFNEAYSKYNQIPRNPAIDKFLQHRLFNHFRI